MKKMKLVAGAAAALVMFLGISSVSSEEKGEHAHLRRSRQSLFHGGDDFCSPSSPCGLCKGDCDTDKDCKGRLKCYQRGSNDPALGCEGGLEDNSRGDYCYDPALLEPTLQPSATPSASPTSPVPTPPPTPPPTAPPTPPPTSLPTSPPTLSPTLPPTLSPTLPLPPPPTLLPTPLPTPPPSSLPTTAQKATSLPPAPTQLLYISYRGENFCTVASPCTECEGDCNKDTQCEGTLKCWQRNANEVARGCTGGVEDNSGGDYCYDPIYDVSPSSIAVAPPSASSGIPIDHKGNDFCTSTNKCSLCEGDCDNDDQCEGDLLCWQRTSGEVARGCIGGPEDGSRGDYCYDPISDGYPSPIGAAPGPPTISPTTSPGIPINHKGSEFCTFTKRCSVCEGDCDNDDQCEGDLLCWQRTSGEVARGCIGGPEDESRGDYCYDPINDVRPSPIVAAPGPSTISPTTSPPLPLSTSPPSPLPTPSPTFLPTPPPTLLPTPPPTAPPTTPAQKGSSLPPATAQLLVVLYRGENFCTVASPCAECEGDCNKDTQCEGNLKCWQRNANEAARGCTGGVEDNSGGDYCYDPIYDASPSPVAVAPPSTSPGIPIDHRGSDFCTSTKKCSLCEGDCDNDDQCEGDLKCWQRTSGEVARGCIGGPDDESRGDYCYDPISDGYLSPIGAAPGPSTISPASSPGIPINHRGSEFCTSTHKCSLCEGDCDKDDQCEGDLKCWQRTSGEVARGCIGGPEDESRGDYCYNATLFE